MVSHLRLKTFKKTLLILARPCRVSSACFLYACLIVTYFRRFLPSIKKVHFSKNHKNVQFSRHIVNAVRAFL